MQSPAPASSLAEPPLAASLRNWGGGSVSRGCDPRGWVALSAAGAGALTTTALAFLRLVTFRTGMILLELATTTAVSTIHLSTYLSIYLCSLAPASSLAEPPPAASPQLGRWI